MTRRWIFIAAGAALAVGLSATIVLPTLQPRCQRWYHEVGSVARQHINGIGSGSSPSPAVRDAAVQEVGAKPFYCS